MNENWPIYLIIGFVLLLILGIVFGSILYEKYHPCLESHQETQYKAPPSVVVGGSKYGGGVAIPVGNMRPVQVEVCDKRQ